MHIKRCLFLIFFLLPLVTQAQPGEKYFGYYGGDFASTSAANPGGPGFEEMKDHINLYSIMVWSGNYYPSGKAASESYVLGELAKAKAAHVHAIVPGFPFVFPEPQVGCPDHADTAAWDSFVAKMVAQGYLIPGDPANSTVVATYIEDEPDADPCAMDVDDAVSPTFQAVLNAVRDNPSTANLPIAAILTQNYLSRFYRGALALDWVGFDYYGATAQQWRNEFDTLKLIAPGKKFIVVPGAMQGCDQVQVNDSAPFKTAIETDPDVVWLAPFAWFSGLGNNPSCKGVRDIPSVRADYTAEGYKIKAGL